MSELIPETPTPQFETAEFAGDDNCSYCHQPIAGSYYRVNGAMMCACCIEQIKAGAPQQEKSAFARAMFFGAGAAFAGLILYSAFAIITGWMIGYVSLAVGYIIAKAMMKGSRGFGGRRYQIAAVLLTYAAVSIATIPITIAQQIKKQNEHKQVLAAQHKGIADQAASQQDTETTGTTVSESNGTAASQDGNSQSARENVSGAGILKGFVLLAAVGLASPFLELMDPLHGLIGLVILFVGLQIAWKIAAGKATAKIEGPF